MRLIRKPSLTRLSPRKRFPNKDVTKTNVADDSVRCVEDSDDQKERLIDRRTLLKSGLLAGGAIAGGGMAIADIFSPQRRPDRVRQAGAAAIDGSSHGTTTPGPSAATQATRVEQASATATARRPNILVVMVDQLRTPQWFATGAAGAALMPNLTRLRRGGVYFDSHYTASNDCTPARSALVTGLYTHQTGCMVTGGSTLDPGFPTWGSMLRDIGYRTAWFGKWHLTHGDNHWTVAHDDGALEPYGFSGGTYPSPDGGPGQGWRVDPFVVKQFEDWMRTASGGEPWCTTVSFVNPHDIAWWYRWSDRFHAESSAPRRVKALPPNFETPEQMLARGKPRLQRSLQDTAAVSFGRVPFAGPDVQAAWHPFSDLYLKLAHEVDKHVGSVMRALHSRPEIASNTVVLFTSDHGEYSASHGLRGKGAAVYEEALRVPLVVRDLRRKPITRAPRRLRRGLTSSVDVAPLMLSIATGSNAWRSDPHFAHLAGRHDVFRMLGDASAPGRPYVLHATDEIVTEFAVKPYAADAPLHVTAIRTPKAKFALYSHWNHRRTHPISRGEERELYDYARPGGILELDSLAYQGSALEGRLHSMLVQASRNELRERLPSRLHTAWKRGFADYHDTASEAALKATARRRKVLERDLEGHSREGALERMLRLQRRGGRRDLKSRPR